MNNLQLMTYDFLIGGKTCGASNNRYFDSVNPSTSQVFAKIADATTEDIHKAVLIARQTFDQQSLTGEALFKQRASQLREVAQLIRQHAKELAELESLDTGKTLKQTTFIDIPTAAETFEFYAQQVGWLNDQQVQVSSPNTCLLQREPVGVVAAIIPWNYPLIMAAWKIAPALLCGNSVILKPSPFASVSLMRLAQIIAQAGLFQGSLNIIASIRQEAGAQLVEHPDVDMVSFSGGTSTGKDVMRRASQTIKKVVLELGGKSPNIVFADCDRNAALGGTLSSIFMNQGQMCTAGSRLLLEDSIYDDFIKQLARRAKSFKIGHALDFQTEFGPIVSREHRDRILKFIEMGIKEGARLICGGKIPQLSDDINQGYYLEPTIFADVKNSMKIAQEEIFGPVLSVIRFKTEEEAITIANDSQYGLAAMVWSKDHKKANRVAQALRVGSVWINTYGMFPNDVPFGGYKKSGFGRELGRDGLFEFTQLKHVCVDQTPGGVPLVAAWF